MSKSIRYYYFTSIAPVLVASVFVMGLIQMYLAVDYFEQDKQNMLIQVVEGVSEGSVSGQYQLTEDSLRTVNYLAKLAGAGAFVTNPAGLVVFTTQGAPVAAGERISPQLLQRLAEGTPYQETGRLFGLYDANYYTAAGALHGPNNELTGYIFASSDASHMWGYLAETLSSFVLAAMLVLLLSSALALLLANRTVIPLRHIGEAARRFGEGDYSARVPVDGDDELAQLAITFNEMANSFEATDQSRRSFMGNIAHELRTPMTSIKGFIDGMLDGTIPEDQRDRYLAVVSEEVGRLARLTRNMLDISKLEAGEYTPNTTEFDIWGPLAAVFLGNEQRLIERNIEVTGILADQQVEVLADEDFVHQVLFNLVDNAIKFSEEGGEIAVKVLPGKAFATVSIRNTGAGIPSDVLPHIFDRFYKADKSRGLNAGGSGLGLHICKVLVGLMGGRIWVESEEDSYTQFSFTLPAAPQKKQSARKAEQKN